MKNVGYMVAGLSLAVVGGAAAALSTDLLRGDVDMPGPTYLAMPVLTFAAPIGVLMASGSTAATIASIGGGRMAQRVGDVVGGGLGFAAAIGGYIGWELLSANMRRDEPNE